MKFHNQRSFMGHEISNVNNKPLLRKKGKQWIVVAVSALILAGFCGMVSTTTHADTTNAKPTTTKVAPKPANDSASVMKQAQGMHKVLTNNAAVQKPSAPSSAVAKKTTPASATSTTSAKSNSVSASSSVSSKASSSVNSASVKSLNNSNGSNNNKATKPAVHMLGLGNPTSTVQTGKWGTANWTLNTSTGNLVISDGNITDYNRESDVGDEHMKAYTWPTDINQSDVKHISFTGNVQAPTACEGLFANSSDNADGNWDNSLNYAPKLKNLESIDLTGLDLNNVKSVKHMFSGDHILNSITGLSSTNTNGLYDMSYMFVDDNDLKDVDLSHFNTQTNEWVDRMFDHCSSLQSVDLSNFDTSDVGNANSGAFSDWFNDTPNLSTINIGPHTNISGNTGLNSKTWIHIDNSDNGAQIMNSNMNYKPGTWIAATSEGTWHNASWAMDNNGNLVIQGKDNDNSITDNKNDAQNLNWNNVHNIYTNNVKAPTSQTSLNSTFAGLPNLQSINLSGMKNISNITDMGNLFLNDSDLININLGNNFDTSNVTNMSGMFQNDRKLPSINFGNSFYTSNVTNMNNMFAGDWALKSLTLPTQFNTRKANISGMFDSDSDLQTLSLPSDFQNTNNSNHIFGWSGNTQVPQLNELTLRSGTYLGTNANLPSTWVNSGNSTTQPVPASTLESGSGHAGTWLNTIQTDNVYYVLNYSDINSHKNIKPCNVSPNTSNNPYYNRNDYFQPKGLLNTSDAILYDKNNNRTDGNNKHAINTIWHENSTYNGDVYQYNLMPGGWNIRTEEGIPNFKFDGGNYYVPIASDNANENIQISYNYNGKKVSTLSSNNVNATSFNADDYIPSGYYAASGANDSSSIVNGSEQLSVNILPNSANANVEYQYNSSTIASHQFNGNSYQASSASDRSTNITSSNDSGIPAGWSLASSSTNVPFDNSNHAVQLTPNHATDTINYQYKGTTLASHQFSGNDYRATQAGDNSVDITSSNDSGIPANYHLASASTSFNYDGGTHPVSVVPNSVTNTIKFSGDNNYSFNVSGPYSTSSSVSAPSGYHYINGSNGNFTYGPKNTSHTFYVAPNSINIIFKNGNDVILVANDVNTSDSKSNMYTIPLNFVPDGYYLTTTSIQLNNNNGQYTVPVAPKSASANIDYQYNGNTIASAEASGSYGTPSSISSNSFSVAGWHLASDGTQDFEFNNASGVSANGSVDVNVLPNLATDTINYQYNGQTLASQPFSGNDYRASQAGDNSVDVTANNDSDIPNGYELVNSNNNFSFNNGTYDVAIQPIPQPASLAPSVPFIPSMPSSITPASSSVSSASSAASAPVSLPAIQTSKASSEAKPTHYRYAKVITPLQLHTSKHFTDKNGVLVIKHPTEFRIMKIVHDHKYTRYEVKYQGHKYFITGNSKFTINDYVQKHDFKSHKHMMVKVITSMIEYKHAHFSRKYAIRVFKKGAVLPVKRVFTIGKGEMTRFELTNGRYVTSNKLFVKVIK